MDFEFVESNTFTKLIEEILDDEQYGELQAFLIQYPECGVLIPGGYGLRKLRWKVDSKGKRGGVRLIYYLYSASSIIFMVYLFKKSERSDLTAKQLKLLAEDIRDKGEI